MPAPAAPPPPPNKPATGNGAITVSIGRRKTGFQPPRLVITAVEGFGKTTLGAFARDPVILMARGETGFDTLRGAGLVPDVDAALIEDWLHLLAHVEHLIANETGHKTCVLDALGGFERLCHEFVCRRDFGGDFGEKSFLSYNKGYEVSIGEWLKLLQALDRLREVRKMTILILSHSMVRPFKNPLGDDFDRYVADVHGKTWGPTHKWADCVLFGNFVHAIVKTRPADKSGKGVGKTARVLYAVRRDAFDAKNRYGMPESIDLTDVPSEGWGIIANAIRGANGND